MFQVAAQYDAIMRVLEEERDYYKNEYEALKALKRSSSARATPTKVFFNTLFSVSEFFNSLPKKIFWTGPNSKHLQATN